MNTRKSSKGKRRQPKGGAAMTQPRPISIEMHPADELVDIIGNKIYQKGSISMLLELVFNSFDAMKKEGKVPRVEIRIYEPGEHPLSKGRCISILDYGPGFTDDVLKAWNIVGRSVNASNKKAHGTHGIGRFSAYGLGKDGKGDFYIFTAREGEGNEIHRILMQAKNVFGQKRSSTVVRRYDHHPKEGSFAEILIPDTSMVKSADEVRTEMCSHLPLYEWSVLVNGAPVKRRKMVTEKSFTTPVIPALGYSIRFELGLPEISNDHDGVWLVDDDTKRRIVAFSSKSVPKSVRANSSLADIRLCGHIFIPGLEEYSTPDRDGLIRSFWKTKVGQILISLFKTEGQRLARDVLGKTSNSSDTARRVMKSLGDRCISVFGNPDLSGVELVVAKTTAGVLEEDEKGALEGKKRDKKETDRKRSSNNPASPRDTGGKPSGPPTGKLRDVKLKSGKDLGVTETIPKSRSRDNLVIRIEDTTYQVVFWRFGKGVPVHVRQGNYLGVDISNSLIKKALALASRSRNFADYMILREVIEAHVAYKAKMSEDVTTPDTQDVQVQQLLSSAISSFGN